MGYILYIDFQFFRIPQAKGEVMPDYVIGITKPSPVPASFFAEYLAVSVECETHQVLEINAQDVSFNKDKNSLMVKLFGSIGETPMITFAAQKILYVENENGLKIFQNPQHCKGCGKNSGLPVGRGLPFAQKVPWFKFQKMRCSKCKGVWMYIVRLP